VWKLSFDDVTTIRCFVVVGSKGLFAERTSRPLCWLPPRMAQISARATSRCGYLRVPLA
jgi:hypothetical protein